MRVQLVSHVDLISDVYKQLTIISLNQLDVMMFSKLFFFTSGLFVTILNFIRLSHSICSALQKNRAKCKLDVAFCSVRNLRDSPKTGIAPTVLSLSRVCQTTVFFT